MSDFSARVLPILMQHVQYAHCLELVKMVKMPSNDQVNSVIPQMRFHMHGNTIFLVQKHASRPIHGKLAIGCEPHGRMTIHCKCKNRI